MGYAILMSRTNFAHWGPAQAYRRSGPGSLTTPMSVAEHAPLREPSPTSNMANLRGLCALAGTERVRSCPVHLRRNCLGPSRASLPIFTLLGAGDFHNYEQKSV